MTLGLSTSGAIKIKTDGGLRAVNCACCQPSEPPPVCCMYSATSAVSADLPAAITLPGVGSLSKSGTNYGNTTNGVILESGVWARYVGGARSTQQCLIRGDGNLTPGNDAVEDQFEACYKIYLQDPPEGYYSSYPGNLFTTVYRKSLCLWDNLLSVDEFGFPIFFGETDVYYTRLVYAPDRQRWYADLGGVPFYFEKSPHQDTPVGAYPEQNIFYPDAPVYTVNVEPC